MKELLNARFFSWLEECSGKDVTKDEVELVVDVDQTGGEHLELSAWASDQIVSDNPDVSVDNVTEDK